MSPALSWLVFGGCVAIGAVVYVVVVGGGRYRRAFETEWHDVRLNGGALVYSGSSTPIRVFGGVYDHEEHGDFHDPIRDHEWCADCNAALRRAFNDLADLDLGPRDADALMAAIRKVIES